VYHYDIYISVVSPPASKLFTYRLLPTSASLFIGNYVAWIRKKVIYWSM